MRRSSNAPESANAAQLADCEPTLSELDGVRYLHFGTEWVQGAMDISRPDDLVLDYTAQMMAWLLFVEPRPEHQVGILGLGAGSLLRFILRNTDVQVETVEWNPQVTAVCQMYFRLPDSPRSTIVHADAGNWVSDPINVGRFSALLVDLYDATAQGPVRDSLEFYQGCRHVLDRYGVMAVNLFGNHASYPHNLANIQQAFGRWVLPLPATPAGNRIVLAFAEPAPGLTTADLLERAEAVSKRYKLPAVRWARALLQAAHPAP